ncbi:MAG TPA: hypothetical protein VMT03_08245 [Polyangia bacterium]|nr:hypothetical protein [Polyangia bacterium]
MKGDDPTPPPAPWVEALLVHERIPPAQPDLVRARLLARADAAPRDPFAAPASRGGPARPWQRYAVAAAGITLVAGAAAAFQMMRPASRLALSAQPSGGPPPPASRPSDPDDGPAIAASPRAAEPAGSAPGPRRRSSMADRRELGVGEIELLERARAADLRGAYTDVLAVLAEHEHRHPAGRLSEERDVLRVKALAGLGRGAEARRAAARFRQRYPRSVLLPKIDEILASLP